MAMVVHELATNAVKYGALSSPNGSVRVSWGQVGSQLKFTWMETGGPSVRTPEREGFGTRVIQSLISDQLKGDLHMDWKPSGLCCEISIDWYAVA
jgi:two-component sensor histidine kinase